jgi:hypothetical protein
MVLQQQPVVVHHQIQLIQTVVEQDKVVQVPLLQVQVIQALVLLLLKAPVVELFGT